MQMPIRIYIDKTFFSSFPQGQRHILHRKWERYFKTMDFRALNCKKSHILAKLCKRYLNLSIQGCGIISSIVEAMKVRKAGGCGVHCGED